MNTNSARSYLSRIALMAVIAISGLSACASSGLVNVWMDPQFNATAMNRMLVVSMNPDAAKRRIWEDAFVEALSERGVKATPSYQQFPDQLPDTSGIISAVNEHGYNGCLVTVRLATEYISQDVPGYITDSLITRYNPWSNRYYNYYQQFYTPGYTETQTVVRHKIEVWSTTGTGTLVWTATSEVLDPTSRKGANHGIIDDIVDDLAKNRVIPSK